MNVQSFRKLIELIKKTGDRLVVVDGDFPEPYVLMDLKGYEKLLSGKFGMPKAFKAEENLGDRMVRPRESSEYMQSQNPVNIRKSIDFNRDSEKNFSQGARNIDRTANYGNMADTGRNIDSDQPVFFEEPTD